MSKIKSVKKKDLNDSVLLKRDNVLAEVIPDYYAAKKKEGYSSHIQEDDDYHVGIVVAAHDSCKNMLGHVVFFMKGRTSPLMNLKEKGKFHLVDMNHQGHLVRLDEKAE